MVEFIHLHCHTEFSLSDGLLRIDPWIETVAKDMPAVAVTDSCNLFALVKFYQACKANKIKPIIGSDLYLHNAQHPARPFVVTALCKNQVGYQNLIKLISRAYLDGQQQQTPIVQYDWLAEHKEGLIILSGATNGDVGQALLTGAVDQVIPFWLTHFPDHYYLELQRIGRDKEEPYIQAALQLAVQQQLPVVATNNVRFLAVDDFEAHEARVCIANSWMLNDPKRARPYTDQQYFRSQREMQALFHDIPEALKNSVEIAKRCNVDITLGKSFLPNFPVPTGYTIDSYFETAARQGLAERLPNHSAEYDDRLTLELAVINKMGFGSYFLIVADFIQWAKNNGIPVGPGRGSGAGSLVAYVLKITDLDPIEHVLLFERFLNPERVSMPDFDVDFCMDGRDRVIDYVTEKYGRQSVSQIITFGTMAAKAVVRDVGRVLAYGYGFVDKIAKLVPFEIGMTLTKALAQEEQLRDLYQKEEEIRVLLDLALKLEGIARNAGKHAGGVVISPSLLTDFTALYCEPDSHHIVTQFDKDDVEAIGLVKFDFLGLRTLTIIDWAIKNIERSVGDKIDITRLPMDDEKSFALLKSCKTTAVFQLESRGMKDLIKRLQPDCFEDIVALVALFRPGPLQSGMVDDFIDRKHGRQQVVYPHPSLEPILKPTYGVILYQEQVMQIAQVMAGYSLGGADILRRAMGKKKPEEMAKQRIIFVTGAKEKGIEEKTANYVFDLMEKFAGYGFNKSHSAAYALIAYQTAYLKAHYPSAFMAAVLSSDMDNTDKVVNFIDECQQLKIRVLPPDINVSEFRFTIKDNVIIYGLGAIKGAGSAAIDVILAERDARGTFKDIFDFCTRVELRKVNHRVLEALVKSGAMDKLGPSRSAVFASIDKAMQMAEQLLRNAQQGQSDLFGVVNAEQTPEFIAGTWTQQALLQGEKESLGLYFSGHPIDRYHAELKSFTTAKIADVRPTSKNKVVIIAGLIAMTRALQTKRGDRMAVMTLADTTGRIDVAVFSDVYHQYRSLLEKDKLVVVEGEVSIDEFSGGYRMSCRKILDITTARETYARRIVLKLVESQVQASTIEQLKTILKPYTGGVCPIQVAYLKADAQAVVKLGANWSVRPTDELINQLECAFGEKVVDVIYED